MRCLQMTLGRCLRRSIQRRFYWRFETTSFDTVLLFGKIRTPRTILLARRSGLKTIIFAILLRLVTLLIYCYLSHAHPLKKLFHQRRSTSKRTALARFTKIFKEEFDQEMIHNMYNFYTKRLHDLNHRDGQMTKY